MTSEFERMLADPYEQFDRDSELLPHILTFARVETAAMVLCGPDGIVRDGAMHHGTDYACTGSAHFDGVHIHCTSLAHKMVTP